MASKDITLLLAEDETQIRDLLTMIFEGEGYSVLVAKDGQEALLIGRAYVGRVDLLISDLQMPGMSGTELAKELRGSRPDLRVLLISGHSELTLTLEQGWHFLKKPFMPSAILAKIDEILSKPPRT